MLDTTRLDEIAKNLAQSVPEGIRQACQDLEKNFKAVLQASFAKLDLVTREEFDAQKGVLLRTREKLEALEKKVKELDAK